MVHGVQSGRFNPTNFDGQLAIMKSSFNINPLSPQHSMLMGD
jgi:hypothetical protein